MKFIKQIITSLLLVFMASGTVFTQDIQPNIIFIFADDMGWGDLSCHGNPRFKTPFIDSLARSGIDFHQFYVMSPVCSPSRAGFLTGGYPMRYSINNALHMPVNIANGSVDWLDPQAPSLARILQSAGYETAHFGKWHLVEEAKNTLDAPMVQEYGFDVAEPMRGPWPGLGTSIPQTTIRNVCDRAVEYIKQPKDRPFFLNLWIHESHVPVGPSTLAYNANSNIQNERERKYAGVITDADNGVGKVLQTLRELNLEDNTIVIFSSDNGPAKGSDIEGNLNYYNFGTTGGRRGTKGTLYEGGVRLPLIVRWPGKTPGNVIDSTTVIAAIDLLPTLVSIVHGTLPSNYIADGENIQQALLGKPQQRRKPIFWYYGNRYAMREGDWKIITDSNFNNAELYNLESDPAETINVEQANSVVVNNMIKKLAELKATLPATANTECNSKYRPAEK